MAAPLVVVGDALLDRDVDGCVERLCPDAPVPVVDRPVSRARAGGAGLAASLASADGRDVVLVTALGTDPAGRELAGALRAAGVDVVDVGLDGETAQKVRIQADHRPLVRVDYGGDGAPRPAGREAVEAIESARAVLVSDYGRGMAGDAAVRDVLTRIAAHRPVVWDPHPRGREPVEAARVVTPNRVEVAAGLSEGLSDDLGTVTAQAGRLRDCWHVRAVAVTLGARGALLVEGDGPPFAVPPPAVAGGDPCGAGDRFAATVAGVLADGGYTSAAVAAGVAAASSFVAAGGATAVGFVDLTDSRAGGRARDAARLAERVRLAGGTVVATGGCFDLLHAGHVALLQAARQLGDCLIVCLNSDRSIRELKGQARPVVPEHDRAALLAALGCVDAVAVFHEPTPELTLQRLRPHIFAKGGDYRGADLPEAAVLARWGGQAVVLPYLEGRSTTRIVKEVQTHARR